MSKRKVAFKTSALSKPGHQHAERLKSNSRRQHASRADAIHLKRACVVDTNAAAIDDVTLWLRTKQQSVSVGDKVISEDIVQLQSLITTSDTPLLLFECLKLATNIALGDLETIVLLQPLLLDIMQRLAQPEFNIPFIKRQLAWLIGNMALSSDSCRDVLAGHVMPWLLQTLIQSEQRESKLESSPQVPRSVIAWALCNMLRGHSLLVLEQIRQQQYVLIQTIVTALQREYAYLQSVDLEMCEELLWCCVYLSAKDDEDIVLACYNSGIAPLVHQAVAIVSQSALLISFASSLLLPAFRVLGNLCLNEAMTLEVIFQQSSTLEMLSSIINSEVDTALKDSLRKGAWRLLETVLNVLAKGEGAPSLQQLLQGVFISDEAFVKLSSDALSSGTTDLHYSVLQILVRIAPIVDLTAIACFPDLITSICGTIREAHVSDLEMMELATLSLLQATDRRPHVLTLLAELDIAEVVENVQYTSTNPELTRLAGTLVELIYSEMDRAEAG